MAAQFTATNRPERPESWCSARATNSLPVPVSPPMTTATDERAMAGSRAISAAKGGTSVRMPAAGSARSEASASGGPGASGSRWRKSRCVCPSSISS